MATQDGSIPIGELEEGDKVLAFNENIGETGEYEVTAVWEHTDEVVFLTIDGEVIETTSDHPFYTQERGWTAVEELEAGFHVRRADGSYGVVEAVSATILSQPMFNLTVDEAHTYFVGNGDWLVHNSCKQYDIIPYRDPAPGFEKHHGVLDVWARQNISKYNKFDAPSLVMTPSQHQLTRDWFNNWRKTKTGSITGQIDWVNLDIREINHMTEEMMRYAGVPEENIRAYISAFHNYIYGLQG